MQKTTIYPVTVDYDMSVEDAIKAGKYEGRDFDYYWISFYIKKSEEFTNGQAGVACVDIELVPFKEGVYFNNVYAELSKNGLRAANARELLALGEQFPDLQTTTRSIIALGSTWEGPQMEGYEYSSCYYFLDIFGYDSYYRLGSTLHERKLRNDFCVAAVRK